MQIALEQVGKSFGSDLIFRGVTARIEDRDRIGLVGINGAGKTTLLNIITGDLEPDEGTVTRPFHWLPAAKCRAPKREHHPCGNALCFR